MCVMERREGARFLQREVIGTLDVDEVEPMKLNEHQNEGREAIVTWKLN